MTNLVPIKVLFICHECGRIYMAVQERARGLGRFDCTECRHRVYEWSGSYNYALWAPVESVEKMGTNAP